MVVRKRFHVIAQEKTWFVQHIVNLCDNSFKKPKSIKNVSKLVLN